MGVGCIEELRKGAQPLYSVRDLLISLGRSAQGIDEKSTMEAQRHLPLPLGLTDEQAKVAKSVRGNAVYPDEICEKTGLSARAVTAALLTLTLRNVVVQGSDGRFRLVTI
jgi:predicted Rossmann fold nucleotide-binding protein DprA/Smf involved in DNA uptake